jgi:hypothetical protein
MGGKGGEAEGIEPRDYITTRCAMISSSVRTGLFPYNLFPVPATYSLVLTIDKVISDKFRKLDDL